MARPATIRDEQILEAARALFLEKGLRATTAEVARRAGVAEGTLFHRFGSKQGLFRAATRARPDEPSWPADGGDPAGRLRAIGIDLVASFRARLPLALMRWSNPIGEARAAAAPLRDEEALADWLRAEIRRGRLRADHPELLARVFVGAIRSHALLELLREPTPPADRFVRDLVALLFGAADPPRPRRRPRRKAAGR